MPATSFPKDKLRILLLENISPRAVSLYHEAGYTDVRTLHGALSGAALAEALQDIHLLGIRSKTQLTAAMLEAAPRLLGIGCYCIGTNQVPLMEAARRGIAVFNAPFSNTRSVAELVIGAAIMLIRRIPDKNRAAHEGRWIKDAGGSHELRGRTLGIVGYGNIGSQVSILAEALGMRVIFYDIVKKLPLGNAVAAASLEDLVSRADIVTLHVPANAQTNNLIDARTLHAFRPGGILINYARGEVADIHAVAEALREERLGGAAFDVYPEEPEKNGDAFHTPLQGLSNVLLTPHIGGSTEEAQANIAEDVTQKLLDFTETGNSYGSHSIPALSLPVQEGAHRILHVHRNMPGVLSEINTRLSQRTINIEGQYLKTNEEVGYVVLDVDKDLSHEAQRLLQEVKGTIRVRLLY